MNGSTSNHNWVCFECKLVSRKPKSMVLASAGMKCTQCGGALVNIGYKIDVPRKADEKGWKELREWCRIRDSSGVDEAIKFNVREMHRLEKEILAEEAKPLNKDRNQRIELMKAKLATIGQEVQDAKE
jgi:hypothetical protein